MLRQNQTQDNNNVVLNHGKFKSFGGDFMRGARSFWGGQWDYEQTMPPDDSPGMAEVSKG
jgi:hypothetical protein